MIELLIVIAIIAIMVALLLPSLSGLAGTAGRRGAVNSLMNGFEQARVAALESGCKVYVIMRRGDNNGSDAFSICRARSDDLGDPASPKFVQLTQWKKLPAGVRFFATGKSLVPPLTPPAVSFPGELALTDLTGKPGTNDTYSAVVFNSRGQVAWPNDDTKLSFYLGELIRSLDGKETAKGGSVAVSERLSFRRYTGRAQLDFAAPASL